MHVRIYMYVCVYAVCSRKLVCMDVCVVQYLTDWPLQVPLIYQSCSTCTHVPLNYHYNMEYIHFQNQQDNTPGCQLVNI